MPRIELPNTMDEISAIKQVPPIILASTSPRRQELLRGLGIEFSIETTHVDEGAFQLEHLSPDKLVLFLSRLKAQEVYKLNPQSIVIGADTVVVMDGCILGKPKSKVHAFNMLHQLQGRQHSVFTGITIFPPENFFNEMHHTFNPKNPKILSSGFLDTATETKVYMKSLSANEIEAYIETNEPMDKAGSYAIQGVGGTLIEKIEGCYFNVMGLSLFEINRLFELMGFSILSLLHQNDQKESY